MDHNNIIIREVTEYLPEIEEAVKRLVAQLDTEFQPLTTEDLRMMIASDSTHLYLSYSGDTITGMVTLITYRIPYKMKAWIEDIVVDTKYRRQGIGEALMHHMMHEAKKYKVKSLNLTSNPAREGANKLYLRLGFEKRETNVYRLTFS